jgi:hypothetical protein
MLDRYVKVRAYLFLVPDKRDKGIRKKVGIAVKETHPPDPVYFYQLS